MRVEDIEVKRDPLYAVNVWENGKVRLPHDEDEEMSILLTIAVMDAEATEVRQAEDFRQLTEAITNGLVVESCQGGQSNDSWSLTDAELHQRQAEAKGRADEWVKQWEHGSDFDVPHFVGCGHRVSNSSLKRQGF